MRKTLIPVLTLYVLCAFGPVITQAAGRDKTPKSKAHVTYGRVKELNAGQKIVVDLDNTLDKSYDLTDKDTTVTLAPGLKVGDPVKIRERDVNGKKLVQVTRHSGGNVKHGDKSRSAEVKGAEKKSDQNK